MPTTPTTSLNGYLYVLTNPSIPGQVKVGRTERNPHDRRKELSAATGIPTPFELVHGEFFHDCHQAEKTVHQRWEQEGRRVSSQREFFRLDAPTAITTLQALAQEENAQRTPAQVDDTKSLIDNALKLGFRWYRGDAATLRNDQRALEHFEQAASMGSSTGAYWAGRSCERISDTVRRKLDQQNWQQRALVHHQAAVYKGNIKACARASWLFRATDQHDEADALWMEFLHRLGRGKMDDESARWVVRWIGHQSNSGRRLPDSKVWATHGPLLLRSMPNDATANAKRALRRQVWPAWKRALIGVGPDVVPLVVGAGVAVDGYPLVGGGVVVLSLFWSYVRRRAPTPPKTLTKKTRSRRTKR